MTAEQRRVWATPDQLAEWLQLGAQGTRKLRKMRADGTGPKFVTVGREIRYSWADVHAWCAARRDRPGDTQSRAGLKPSTTVHTNGRSER